MMHIEANQVAQEQQEQVRHKADFSFKNGASNQLSSMSSSKGQKSQNYLRNQEGGGARS